MRQMKSALRRSILMRSFARRRQKCATNGTSIGPHTCVQTLTLQGTYNVYASSAKRMCSYKIWLYALLINAARCIIRVAYQINQLLTKMATMNFCAKDTCACVPGICTLRTILTLCVRYAQTHIALTALISFLQLTIICFVKIANLKRKSSK